MEARSEPAVNSVIIMQWHVGWRKLCSFSNSFGKGGKFCFGFLGIYICTYYLHLILSLTRFHYQKAAFNISLHFTSFIMPRVDFDVKYSDADSVTRVQEVC